MKVIYNNISALHNKYFYFNYILLLVLWTFTLVVSCKTFTCESFWTEFVFTFAYLQCSSCFLPLGCDSKIINSSLALYLMAQKKFQIFGGWGWGAGLFFCSAGESCLNGEQEHNRPREEITRRRGQSAKSRRRRVGGGRDTSRPCPETDVLGGKKDGLSVLSMLHCYWLQGHRV